MGTPLSSLSPKAQEQVVAAMLADTARRTDIKLGGLKWPDNARKNENHARSQIPHAKPEPDQTPALERAIQGETKSLPRTLVRFIGYRVRPLDPDNFAGSVKDLLDGVRHAGLILGDEPWRIRLETEQVRVNTTAAESTTIEIEIP